MYSDDQLECLRSIRRAFIHCARYDEVSDATLQRLDLEPRLAGCLVSLESGPAHHGSKLEDICMATGCILYFHNRKIQSSPLLSFRGALLRYLQDACATALSPSMACCYGVIASVLLQASEAQQIALPWRNCIVAALAACIYLQLSHPVCSPPAILMYSSSISSSFSACVLEAQRAEEVHQLMQPLLRLTRTFCTPASIGAGTAMAKEARIKLQRLVVPLVLQLSRRLHQIRGQDPDHRKVPHSTAGRQNATMWTMLTRGAQMQRAHCEHQSFQGCEHAATSTIAAADAANLLAMVYHHQTRECVPNLPQCISTVLQLLASGPTSALLLAERVPVPCHLRYLQEKRAATSNRIAAFSTGLHHMGGDAEGGELIMKQFQELLREHLLPAMQAAGYWPDAAAFMLTLVQSCLPHQHAPIAYGVSGGEKAEVAWWSKFLRCLLPVLAALSTSCTTQAQTAIEVALAVMSGCPDACELKRHMCLELAGVLVIARADELAGQQLNSLMKGVASLCEHPGTVLDVCWLCTALSCNVDPPCSAYGSAVALVWVVIYGELEIMLAVLDMAEKLLSCLKSISTIRACLSEIRAALEHCHDFRKKPFCVRWYHKRVQAVAML